MATTKILMAAVKRGSGRESAHEAIKEHAVAVALRMREQGATENDLVARLGNDARIPLSEGELKALLGKPLEFVGAAVQQSHAFVKRIETLAARFPEASAYRPEAML
ncbi:MAG: hypothetical protein QM784_18495 [Polyangiaceae bacterium]